MIQPTNVSRELNNRLEKWRKKLLDLSLKNPLLSMRTNVGLSVWHPTPQPLFSLLNTEQKIEFLPLPISEEGGLAPAIAQVAPDYARRHKLNTVGFDSKDVGFTATSETHVAPTRKRLDASALSDLDRGVLEKFLSHTKPLNGATIVVDATAQQLTDQLVRMDRTNRQKEDESGVHVLFMAVGMVHWSEGKSTRIAPLLLVPVSLHREHATDPFVMQRHDDEIALNPALMHMFVQNHAVEWADTENALTAEKVDFNKIVAAAQVALKGLALVQMEARLSLFSYAKHHMWNDLSERAKRLEQHPVVQKIVGVPLTVGETLFPNVPKEKLDEVCPPDSVLLPLPADSSQIHAIARVNQGESLVIQGPPGTGKSQTITNLIANLLSQGKRVLFVAEKLTALGVVHERLDQLGLGAFCLELHTQSSSKQHVLTQLQEGLAVRNAPLVHGYNEAALALQNLRLSLNQSLDALHQEYPNGLTIYRAIGRLAQHPNAPIIPGLVFPNILEETTETVLERKHAAIKYAQAVRLKNDAAQVFDVWRDLELANDKQVWELFNHIISDIQNVGQLVRQWPALYSVHPTLDVSAQQISKWLELVELWKNGSDIPLSWKRAACETLLIDDYTAFRAADKNWSSLWNKFSKHFNRTALNDSQIWKEYTANQEKWALNRWFSSNAWNKKASKHFVNNIPPQGVLEEFCQQFETLSDAFEQVDMAAKTMKSHLPQDSQWDSNTAAFPQRMEWIKRATTWGDEVNKLVQSTPQLKNVVRTALEKEEFLIPRAWSEPNRFEEFASLLSDVVATSNKVDGLLKANWKGSPVYNWDEVNITAIEQEISRWLLSQSSWTSWRSCERYRHDALQYKLAAVVDAIDKKQYEFDQIEVAMDCTYANAFVNTARMEHPEWVALQGGHREHAIEHFRKESEKFDTLTQKYVVGKLAERLRSQPIDEWDDMVVFKRETMKKVRHLPTRKLIRKLPKLLPVIKPCLMMSPVSVAEYLSNDVDDFDVVIFDEASQITTADAIGAVSRGKQVVVVGDPKQMPPTRMFSVDDDDETEEGDLDSILTECLGSGMKSVLLNWHYRSRNENLIAFSNKTYYGGELITFPSADVSRSDRGLLVHEVNGVYDRGGSGTNSDEARAIVQALVKHIKDPNCHQSIGVVTFNQKQQNLIENMWDKTVAADPVLEHALLRLPQPLTIKNLESVQGDERDVILFSTTFGKDLDGRFMLNFGPLGQVGGERRLNVAITRARDKMEIFSSFHPNEIDPARVTHQGVRDLREWLMFARGGQFAPSLAQSLGMPDSPFELAILEGLHKRGWKVQPQVGCSGYRIDIAVVDPNNPGHYLAGVECDGATYHSFKAARDRDKQRQGVLEGLGWSIVRVWSTDFFENREKELDRVHHQLQRLSEGLSKK